MKSARRHDDVCRRHLLPNYANHNNSNARTGDRCSNTRNANKDNSNRNNNEINNQTAEQPNDEVTDAQQQLLQHKSHNQPGSPQKNLSKKRMRSSNSLFSFDNLNAGANRTSFLANLFRNGNSKKPRLFSSDDSLNICPIRDDSLNICPIDEYNYCQAACADEADSVIINCSTDECTKPSCRHRDLKFQQNTATTTTTPLLFVNTTEKKDAKMLQHLSYQVFNIIFSFLSLQYLVSNVFNVSRRMRAMVRQKDLWSRLDFAKQFNVSSLQGAARLLNSVFGENGAKKLNGDVFIPLYEAPQLLHTTNRLTTQFHQLTKKDLQLFAQVYPNLKGLQLPIIETTSSSMSTAPPLRRNSRSTTANQLSTKLHSLDDSSIMALACFKKLKKMVLSNHKRITDVGIQYLARSNLQLQMINLDYATGVSLRSISALLPKCELRKLSLLGNGNFNYDDAALNLLSRNGRQLKEVRLDFGSQLSERAVQNFFHNCTNINNLVIRGWPALTAKSLQGMCQKLRRLRKLTLICSSDIRVTNLVLESSSLEAIRILHLKELSSTTFKCKNLQSIYLEGIQQMYGIRIFEHCSQKLRNFTLHHCPQIANTDFQHMFKHAHQLEHVELADCGFNGPLNIIMDDDSSPYNLQSVVIYRCSNVESCNITSDTLKELTIDLCNEIATMQINCPHLDDVHFFENGAKFNQQSQMRLQSLSLDCNQLKGINLSNMKHLSDLNVRSNNLGALNLSGCKLLRELTIDCPKLEKLALNSSSIDFSSGVHCSCDNISMFSLSNANLYDNELDELLQHWEQLQALVVTSCKNLKNVTVYGSNVKGIQFDSCSNLESVHFSAGKSDSLSKVYMKNCNQVSDQCLQQIGAECENVQFLEIIQCAKIRNPILMHKNLVDVCFKQCQALARPIIGARQLKKFLCIDCPSLEDIVQLPFPSHLEEEEEEVENSSRHLDVLLAKCPKVSDRFCESLSTALPNINTIVFSKCGGLQFPNIGPLLQIGTQRVKFVDCHNLSHPIVKEDQDQKAFKQRLPSLDVLYFQGCPKLNLMENTMITGTFTTQSLQILQCQNIECAAFGLKIVAHKLLVKKCNSLVALGIKSTSILHVDNCEKLQVLQCGRDSLANAKFVQCPNLLNIISSGSAEKCALVNVEFDECANISDGFISHVLATANCLENLLLHKCSAIRTPAINHSNLQSLRITNCDEITSMELNCPKLVHLSSDLERTC